MSTTSPDLPDGSELDLSDVNGPDNTDDPFSHEEPPPNLGMVAFVIGAIGLVLTFFGFVSGGSGNPNLLDAIGGILMSLSAFIAVHTIWSGTKKGRVDQFLF